MGHARAGAVLFALTVLVGVARADVVIDSAAKKAAGGDRDGAFADLT